jgi:hypothetical protein
MSARELAMTTGWVVAAAAAVAAAVTTWLLVTAPATVAMAIEGRDAELVVRVALGALAELLNRVFRYL